MNKRILIYLACAAMALVNTASKPAVLEFTEQEYDFGTVTETHEPIVHEFHFTNASPDPVAIQSVSTGCGCATPSYPVEPVKSGKTGSIKITFLPKGQRGAINKDIRVRFRPARAKRDQRITLRLRGHVTPADKK